MKKRLLAFTLVAITLLCSFVACGVEADENKNGIISIGAMNGPTMMGLGKLYADINADANSKYTIGKEGTADAIIAGLANKTYDVACIPCNNAAIIYNNGNIDVQVAAINTSNVLYLIQKAGTAEITSLSDLSGKTIFSPGQGSTPEFVLRYLLSKNDVQNVNIEFESEGSTIAAGLKVESSKYDYAVLPQPAATTAISGAGAARQALNLSNEWKKHNPGSDIITGVLVVRTAFLKNNGETVKKFLQDYEASVRFMTVPENIDTAAQYVVDMGIVPAVGVAKSALPKCGISFISGTDMKNMVSEFLNILYSQNQNSIGGKLPKNGFYYVGK